MPEGLPLRVVDIYAGYGKLEILHGVNMYAEPGELVAIVGPNGSGKSTLLKTIMGFTSIYRGRIIIGDKDMTRTPPNRKPYHGVTYVPQVNNVFPSLSVEENLKIAGLVLRDTGKLKRKMEEVFDMFPVLRERRRQKAGTLSGGERQMLAIGRALMMEPRLMLLDEPTAALSPKVAEEVFKTIIQIARSGITVILVEQNAKRALEISDRGYIMVQGQVIYEGPSTEILSHPELGKLYLGLLK